MRPRSRGRRRLPALASVVSFLCTLASTLSSLRLADHVQRPSHHWYQANACRRSAHRPRAESQDASQKSWPTPPIHRLRSARRIPSRLSTGHATPSLHSSRAKRPGADRQRRKLHMCVQASVDEMDVYRVQKASACHAKSPRRLLRRTAGRGEGNGGRERSAAGQARGWIKRS